MQNQLWSRKKSILICERLRVEKEVDCFADSEFPSQALPMPQKQLSEQVHSPHFTKKNMMTSSSTICQLLFFFKTNPASNNLDIISSRGEAAVSVVLSRQRRAAAALAMLRDLRARNWRGLPRAGLSGQLADEADQTTRDR